MDVLPLSILPLPDSRLFEAGRRESRGGFPLNQPNVGDDGAVSHQSHMRVDHGGLRTRAGRFAVEIELVERHAGHAATEGLRFVRRQRIVAQACIQVPIPVGDRVEQLLRELQQFLRIRISHVSFLPRLTKGERKNGNDQRQYLPFEEAIQLQHLQRVVDGFLQLLVHLLIVALDDQFALSNSFAEDFDQVVARPRAVDEAE